MQPAQLEALRRTLGAHGDRIAPEAAWSGPDVVCATSFLQPDRLREAIEHMASSWQTSDLQVAASLWTKQYNAALLSGPLALMALQGTGLDCAAESNAILQVNGVPKALVPLNLSATVVCAGPRGAQYTDRARCDLAALRRFVVTGLIEGHLAPLFEQVCRLTGISRKILWGNAGNICAFIYDELDRHSGGAPAVAEDRAFLLGLPELPFLAGPNPLYNPVRYEALNEPGLQETVVVRHTCCLKHKAPNSRHCYTCPLIDTAERVAIIKELAHA